MSYGSIFGQEIQDQTHTHLLPYGSSFHAITHPASPAARHVPTPLRPPLTWVEQHVPHSAEAAADLGGGRDGDDEGGHAGAGEVHQPALGQQHDPLAVRPDDVVHRGADPLPGQLRGPQRVLHTHGHWAAGW